MRHSYAGLLKRTVLGGRPLWPFKMLFSYLKIKAAAAAGRPVCVPLFATLSVTRRCNSHCAICRLGGPDGAAPPEPELTLEEFRRVIDGLKDAGAEVIGVTGGEPLLRDDIFELFAHIKRRGMGVWLSTNGTLLDDRRIELLLASGIEGINVSLDGVTAATHDSLRGLTSFDALLRNIARFLELRAARGGKTKLNLVMVLNGLNLAEAPEMPAFARSLGVDGIGFMPFHALDLDGAAADRLRVTDLALAEKVMSGLIALKRTEPVMENTARYLALFMRSFRGEPSPLKCYAMQATIAVDASGGVYPCFPRLQTGRKVGSVRRTSLKELARSPQFAAAGLEAGRCRDCCWNCQTELNLLFNGLSGALS